MVTGNNESEALASNQLNPEPCDKCGEKKPFSGFYFKKDRNAYDKTCSVCRKAKRKEDYREQSSAVTSDHADAGLCDVDLSAESDPEDSEQVSTQTNSEEYDRAVRVILMLKRWYDEALAKGPIEGWQTISLNNTGEVL
jgi:hypothetical protein